MRNATIGLAVPIILGLALLAGPFAPGGKAASQNAALLLQPGNNHIAYGGPTLPVAEALNDAIESVTSVWQFNAQQQAWRLWSQALPDALQAFTELVNGETYWVVTAEGVVWNFAAGTGAVGLAAEGVDLLSGFNSVAYNGIPLPAADALGGAAASVGSIFLFDAAANRWLVWNSALPAALRGFSALQPGQPYFVRATAATFWQFPQPTLSTAEADQIVLDQIVRPDALTQDILVFRHSGILGPDDVVLPGLSLDPVDPLVIDGPSYLYWLEDVPGARFDHPARFALVNTETGGVAVTETRWWPQLNGEALFVDPAEYANPENWVFSRLNDFQPPASGGDGAAARRPGGLLRTAQTDVLGEDAGECALAVNGWAPGEVEAGFEVDFLEARKFFVQRRFGQIGELRTPNNTSRDFEETVTRLANRADCKDLTIYISTHGSPGGYIWLGGDAYHVSEFNALLELNKDAADFKVIIDACYSGGVVNNLTNVEVAISSTDATTYAWGDWDPSWDPNPDDTGGEFSSGFFEDLNDLHNRLNVDSALLTRYRAAAAANNISMVALMHHCAYDSAVAKDAKAIQGSTSPQRTTTVTERIQRGSDAYGNPIFVNVAFPCP